ncbi:hypothetical protein PV797_02885 [Clostridiaceae bacterium M8S5]|nr:hypothetical protein PV797_02885 [Clostridiaceae bacterium M8S5]
MDKNVMNWLLQGAEWIKYAVKKQLLGNEQVSKTALNDEKIMKVIKRLKDPKNGLSAIKTGEVYYTKTGNAYWDLFFLADIGFNVQDLDVNKEIEEVLNLQSEEGKYITQNNIKDSFFCIPTILLTSIVKLGYKEDIRIKKYVDIILETQRLDGGWHCAKNRAAGNKLEDTESCPMDNLNVLMLLGQYEEYKNDSRFNPAIDLLLSHWDRRAEKWRPYGFGIGRDFKKLKYPAVKYGILRVLDVLSLYPYAVNKKEFIDMLDCVKEKQKNGKYQAESIVKSYSEFDFGQKKEPSRWITFLINRIIQRASTNN